MQTDNFIKIWKAYRLVPLPRTKKPISLTGIKNNTIENNINNYIGNFLRLKKKSETIKDKIIKDVRALL